MPPLREAIIRKKFYFAKKFHKTPTGGGGHRFTKLFRKIEFFLMMAFLTHDVIF